jgi:hypothetical protein
MLTPQELFDSLNHIRDRMMNDAHLSLMPGPRFTPYRFLRRIVQMLLTLTACQVLHGVDYDLINMVQWLGHPTSAQQHYCALVQLWHRFAGGDLRDVDLRNLDDLPFTVPWIDGRDCAWLFSGGTRGNIAAYCLQRSIHLGLGIAPHPDGRFAYPGEATMLDFDPDEHDHELYQYVVAEPSGPTSNGAD